jgi:hypothetical protein
MYVLSSLVPYRDSPASGGPTDNDLATMAWRIARYTAASGWSVTPVEFFALSFEMAFREPG